MAQRFSDQVFLAGEPATRRVGLERLEHDECALLNLIRKDADRLLAHTIHTGKQRRIPCTRLRKHTRRRLSSFIPAFVGRAWVARCALVAATVSTPHPSSSSPPSTHRSCTQSPLPAHSSSSPPTRPVRFPAIPPPPATRPRTPNRRPYISAAVAAECALCSAQETHPLDIQCNIHHIGDSTFEQHTDHPKAPVALAAVFTAMSPERRSDAMRSDDSRRRSRRPNTLTDEFRSSSGTLLTNAPAAPSASFLDKPLASGNGLAMLIHLAEPILYLQGLDTQESQSSSRTTMLRGSLVLRVSKPSKLKSINLRFRGRAMTDWPEGESPRSPLAPSR